MFEVITSGASTTLQQAEGIKVVDAASDKVAAGLRQALKHVLQAIEDERKSLTGPLNDEAKRINAEAKKAAEPYARMFAAIEKAMTDWHSAEEQRMLDEQRKQIEREARHLAKDDKIDEAVATHGVAAEIAKVVPKTIEVGGDRISFVLDYEITVDDPEAVPCRLCKHEPSLTKIKAALKSGETAIPGITWREIKKPRG